MAKVIPGIHYFTASAAEAERNIASTPTLLGQRLVKMSHPLFEERGFSDGQA